MFALVLGYLHLIEGLFSVISWVASEIRLEGGLLAGDSMKRANVADGYS